MIKHINFFAPFAFIISIILILSFKTIPTGKLWNNYSVLYVPIQENDDEVINSLTDCNIQDYVALSKQYLPINLSQNSIEYSMYKLIISNNESEYQNKRLNYFYDKSNLYRLYYIPNNNKSQLNNVVESLNIKKIKCGVDSSTSYPWILPIIGFVIIILLSFFSKNKNVFFIGSISPLIFLFCNPFFPIAFSLCLLLLVIFFISNIWKRKDFILTLINSYSVCSLLGLSLLCAFSSSIKTGFLFFFELISTYSVLQIYYSIENYFRRKKSFIPVYIKTSKMVNMYANKSISILLILFTVFLLYFGVMLFSSNENFNSHFSKLLLPANTEIKDDRLSQFEDYYKWTWTIKTAPYISLNQNKKSNIVEYPKYFEDEKGLIKETKEIMTYNQDFREKIFNEIDSLQFNSIEKVLKSEGSHFNGGYKSTNSYHNSIFGIIMSFICLFMLLFLYFSIIIKRGTNK